MDAAETSASTPRDQRADRPATAVVVLGMHRSGTSAVTRMLNLLGVDLGQDLMQAVEGNNETGFWEHQGIVDRHQALMVDLAHDWEDPRRMPDGWAARPESRSALEDIVAIAREEFANSALWGVKDPRMCRLLPLWREAWERLEARPVYVMVLRNPLEIASSLSRRDQMSRGRALLLWLRHAIEAERESRGAPRVFVSYDAVMADWRGAAQAIAETLSIPLAIEEVDIAEKIDGFLSPRQRHHALDDEALFAEPALSALAGRAHAALRKAMDGDESDLADSLGAVERDLDIATSYYEDAIADATAQKLRLLDDLSEQHHRVHERELWVAARDHLIADRDVRIAEQKERVEDLRAQLGTLAEHYEAALEAQRNQLIAMGTDLAGVREHVSSLERLNAYLLSRWTWRATRPLRAITRGIRGLKGVLRLETHRMIPDGLTHMRRDEDGAYFVEAPDSFMMLKSDRGRMPTGWVEIDYHVDSPYIVSTSMFVDSGEGIQEKHRIRLQPSRLGRQRVITRLPDAVLAIRFDPVNHLGRFRLGEIRIRELNDPILALQLLWERIKLRRGRRGGPDELVGDVFEDWKRGGWRAVKEGLRFQALVPPADYRAWYGTFAELSDADWAAIRRHIAVLPNKPLISIVMPVYNTDPALLAKTIASVKAQLYENWELCIADDASPNEATKAVLRAEAAADKRIKVVFRETNGHISQASNSALELATGQYMALLDHDDLLTEHALYLVANEVNEHPSATIVYSDEDKIDGDEVIEFPYFKTDWSPDMFRAHNFINHLGVYRMDEVRAAGGFRTGFEGGQDYDLALRVLERSENHQVRHIPFVLYHWRALEGSVALAGSEKDYAHEAGRKAVREHLARLGVDAEVVPGTDPASHRVIYALPKDPPKVSVIVPTRNRVDLLKLSVGALLDRNSYSNWDLVIVDNGSDDEATLDYLREVSADPRIQVMRDDGPFNFSRLNNRAADRTDGELILLLNNDIEAINDDWLTEMVRQILQPNVGAVGSKLYYPDDTIQHAGVTIGTGGLAGHFEKRQKRDSGGYYNRLKVVQNFSCVTAACLLIRREVWEAVEGLDAEHLAVAFNDVDLCLKVVKAGWRIVWTPYSELYHHESVSRGVDTEPHKQRRFLYEVKTMQSRWADEIAYDPFYSPNLGLARERPDLAFPPRVTRPWEPYFDL